MVRFSSRRIARVLLSMLVLLIGLSVAVYWISSAAFASLEAREARSDLRRVKEAIAARTDALESVAGDWGTWDDTYSLLLGQNPTFAAENMQGSMLQTLRVDIMAFVTDDGRIVESRRVDQATGEPVPFPGSMRTRLASKPAYLDLDEIGQTSKGLIMSPEGPLLYAASAVTDNASKREPQGTIFVARYLDAAEIANLSSQTKLAILLHGPDDLGTLPVPVRRAFEDGSTETIIDAKEAGSAVGYTVLRDAQATPALVLSVHFPRTIFLTGQRSMLNSGVALFLFGAVALVLVGLALGRQYREIQERRRAEAIMHASEQRYRCLITSMADAVFGLDADGKVIFANPEASVLTGYSNEDLIGMGYGSLMPSSAAEWIRSKYSVTPGQTESCEIQLEHASGKPVPVEMSISAIDDGSGEGVIVQWIARDITERKRHEEELVRLADHDHLTGLINRRRFEDELDRALERCRRGGRSGVLLWIDLDGLKDINDTFGHKCGDDVLVVISTELEHNLPAGSVLSRIGGDEFGVLLQNIDVESGLAMAESLLQRVNELEFSFDEQSVHVTGSVGLTEFPGHGTTSRELLSRADMAMYRAKEEDRNTCRIYHPDEDWAAELSSRFEWTSVIEKALAEDRFMVYAQPIIRLADGSIDRYELLIRMRAEDGSMVPPGEFMPVAERVGLIHQIDRWMVRRAIELLDEHRGDRDLRLDVNLSGTVLTDPMLLPLIESELELHHVDPSRFGVEITETVAICDMAKARSFIESLKDVGCSVTLDDFGSGFSSFYYLNNLPIDGLKIDGAFVKNLCRSTKDQHVVRAMVELTKGFGITSTAEWVEDEATLEMLKSYGVTCGQGFVSGRPRPADEILGGAAPVIERGDVVAAPHLLPLSGPSPVPR